MGEIGMGIKEGTFRDEHQLMCMEVLNPPIAHPKLI